MERIEWTKDRVKELRLKMGWSPSDFARHLAVEVTTIHSLEAGTFPHMDSISSLLTLFWNQAENLSTEVSLIHQVESGHMKPDLNLALKIGKYFEIRLVEKYVEADVKELQIDFKNKNLTIGDLIKFKKNEKD